MECRNPYCENEPNDTIKGWCRRCYNRFRRCGTLPDDHNVPNSAARNLVSIFELQLAASQGISMSQFIFEEGVAYSSVQKALREYSDQLESMGIDWPIHQNVG